MLDESTPQRNSDEDGKALQALSRLMWETGDLRGLLLNHQISLYDYFYETLFKKNVFLCSRRFGKSALFVVLSCETCLKKNGAKVRYGAATQKMVEELIVPIIQLIVETAPEEIRPQWFPSKGKLLFPTRDKSQLVVSGLDEGRGDRLRGTDMDLGIIDEAQDVDDLDYVIRSVLMPQTLTTGGRIVLGGTSPKTPAHPFRSYIESADREGSLVKRTIYDDSRPEVLAQIPEFQKEAGGAESTTWLREYMVEIITEQESAIVPEMARADVRARLVQKVPRPPHCLAYTVIDLGLIDYTAAVFGYVDFLNAKKVIIGEYMVNRQDSKHIADAILAKEKELWGADDAGFLVQKIRRYADGAGLTVADLNSLHGLQCTPVTNKDELDAMVNELRLDVQSGRLQIAPECVETVKQLHYGIWDKQHKKFARSSAYGHFDLLAATMYFVRNVNMRENPYPENWGTTLHTHHVPVDNKGSYTKEAIKGAFKL